jgi:hypothetical protein
VHFSTVQNRPVNFDSVKPHDKKVMLNAELKYYFDFAYDYLGEQCQDSTDNLQL